MNETKINPKIILIAGCNGAGKSTLAPFLLRDTFGLTDYVNADTIAQGLSAFAPEKVALEAGRVMLKRLRDLAHRREHFAVADRQANDLVQIHDADLWEKICELKNQR